jgi:hypothetical protein
MSSLLGSTLIEENVGDLKVLVSAEAPRARGEGKIN